MKKIIYILLFSLLIGCKKEDTNSNTPTGPTPDIIIGKNVRVMDSIKLILNSDPTLLNQGKYEYSFTGTAPDIKVNDIIVGQTDGGYIRKVTSVVQSQNKLALQTTQGDMEDVFQKANFGFSTNLDDLHRGHMFDFSGVTLFQSNLLTIKLEDGHFDMDGDWNFGFDYENFKLDSFEMSYKNAFLTGQFNLNVTASQSIGVSESTKTLARVSKYKTVFVGPVPVVIYMEVELRCVYSAEINSTIQTNLIVTTDNSVDVGLKYINSQWQNTFNKSSASTLSVGPASGNAKATVKLAIVPYVSFRLYRILGPYASLGIKGIMTGQVASPSLDWNFYAGAWFSPTIGVQANILGKSIFDKSLEWNTDTIYYQTPDRINKISGDNQIGPANQYLSQPLKVKVVDTKGNKQSNVVVYFTVKSGGGTVENSSVITDANGEAQTRWKPGNLFGIQYLEATVKKADGTLINGAPIEFACSVNGVPILTTNTIGSITQTSAISGGNITSDGGSSITARGVCWSTFQNPTIANNKTTNGSGIGTFTSNLTGLTANTTYYVRAYATAGTGTTYGNQVSFTTQQTSNTFTDPRDGQVYTYMQIGSQTWMTQNLNYNAVGSWCFANNTSNCSIYGRLYNWNTALTVAPPGWHLPSDAEWTTLTDFLGGVTLAGGAMKETGTTHWQAPNTAATNSSGFTGLPGGYIFLGSSDNLGYFAYWWSSTGVAGVFAYSRYLFSHDSNVERAQSYNRSNDGMSIRCIKD